MRGAVSEATAALWKVSAHFRAAFAYRMPFTATHLVVRLITSALFAPLIGLLLGTVVGFSGRTAVTDQDIAQLLLTPAGLCIVLIAISLGIAAAVLDVTVMMHILTTRELRVLPAIRKVLPSSSHVLRAYSASVSGFSCACSASLFRSFWRWQRQRIGCCANTTSTTTLRTARRRLYLPPPSSQLLP